MILSELNGDNADVELDEEVDGCIARSDSNYSMNDDDALFDQNIDQGAEWIGKIR